MLEATAKEALALNKGYIGTENLLLALIRLRADSVAIRVLATFNLIPEMIRHTLRRKLQAAD
ncbi:MAG TPA: Clp protease N-terminal domain-containing protein [Aggregatilineales bacterium]|nr:hypothetical protein [Anaerolineae bacterium]HUN09512.1 Clp protease N-terminal domain-containing protein [Aggregatilineales bacterium]